jgi:hypothetical protein
MFDLFRNFRKSQNQVVTSISLLHERPHHATSKTYRRTDVIHRLKIVRAPIWFEKRLAAYPSVINLVLISIDKVNCGTTINYAREGIQS